MVVMKQKSYGRAFDQALDEYGELAGLMRFGDKLNRAKMLMSGEKSGVDESLTDAFHDLIGYSLLMLDRIDRGEMKCLRGR